MDRVRVFVPSNSTPCNSRPQDEYQHLSFCSNKLACCSIIIPPLSLVCFSDWSFKCHSSVTGFWVPQFVHISLLVLVGYLRGPMMKHSYKLLVVHSHLLVLNYLWFAVGHQQLWNQHFFLSPCRVQWTIAAKSRCEDSHGWFGGHAASKQHQVEVRTLGRHRQEIRPDIVWTTPLPHA